MKNKPRTLAVGMSGGVDSAVAAYLLKQQGYDVVGIIMKIWDDSISLPGYSLRASCYGPGEEEDIKSAKKAAQTIGIPLYEFDLHEEYKEIILAYFRQAYLSGKTPNPCVLCNRKIKFGLLLDRAMQNGIHFELFATGHYAQVGIDTRTQRHVLKRAFDPQKDQSYFLYRLGQKQLEKTVFPLGKYLKNKVREIAPAIGLKDFADKPESQDFFAGNDYSDFFQAWESQQGDIIDAAGRVLGRHSGIIHYTIGQRKGLNLGGLREPLYVIGIDSCRNQIIVGNKHQLLAKSFIAGELNWISVESLQGPIVVSVKTRAHSPDKPCSVIPLDKYRVRVVFKEPQVAITPGQSAVFYDDHTVVGGGVIQLVE